MAEAGFDRAIDLNAKLGQVIDDYVEADEREAQLRKMGTESSPTPVIDSLVSKLTAYLRERALKEIDFIRFQERRRVLGKLLGMSEEQIEPASREAILEEDVRPY